MQIPQRQHGGVHWHGQGWSGWSGWGTPKAVLPTSFPHTARADASTVGFLSQVSRKTKTRSRRAHPKPGQQRDEAGASIGGDHPIPSRTARNFILPRASLRAQCRFRRAPPNSAPKNRFPSGPAGHPLQISKSVPFCVNRWDRPCGQPIGVSSVRTLP